MIDYKKGDLVQALRSGEVEAIAHQANCFNTMNSGVAKAIRLAYPEAYAADCQTLKGDFDKLGTLSSVIIENEQGGFGWIFNLYGQFNYGTEAGVVYTDIEALRNAVKMMRLFLDAANITKIGVPKMGCGLGGADWEDVEAILIEELDDFDVTVYSL